MKPWDTPMPATSLIANLGWDDLRTVSCRIGGGWTRGAETFPDYRMDRAQLVGVVTHHKPLEWNPWPPLNVVLASSF